MRIICVILLVVLFLGCKKQIIKNEMNLMNEMNFVPNKSIKIKNLLPFKKDNVCIGSYTIKNDSIVSQFEIQSKYSLIVIKLKNISKNYTFNHHQSNNYPTSGYFSTIDEGLYEVNLSTEVFKDAHKINRIDFFSDKEVNYQVNNDTIKSFDLNFNKYVIKINSEDTKVIYSKIEYYGLKSLNANVLFYTVENEGYIFIMTPLKKDISLDKNILYDYLFG
ncbi:hypothetical protein DMB65_15460 [Flavobacterium cheongpyeongense]|uniref:Uncharacterized protein n=1 Tax=Flavobacterium cheongpyeongense TaxID=2212651 RepID=A0A2V4BPL9_9FLAO|nr:hypothetical protein [Flavobacterium cheongpyeongense]PXY39913.1 hypothetical protein DMB65_15460 [Flavobacterium cheongpyeongense]